MKIIVIGGTGTVGRGIVAELGTRHEVVVAARRNGPERVDITDEQSIRALYQRIGRFDAVVCAAGGVHFGPLAEFGPEQFRVGLDNKLMGQVMVAMHAREHLNDGGSITLTSGILTEDPIVQGCSASMVNGAVEAFVRAAAIELPRGLRINVVSATVLEESLGTLAPFFRGFQPAPGARVALAYAKSVEGGQTGQVYRVR